jgi:hypothetical protein
MVAVNGLCYVLLLLRNAVNDVCYRCTEEEAVLCAPYPKHSRHFLLSALSTN